MAAARLQYQRNHLRKVGCYIAALAGILVATLALSPIETPTRGAVLGAIVVIIGGLALIAVRRSPVVPCPSCKVELASVIKAALRARRVHAVCPYCGSNVEV